MEHLPRWQSAGLVYDGIKISKSANSVAVSTLLLTKYSGTFPMPPKTFLHDSIVAQQYLNIWTESSYLLSTVYVQCDSTIHHEKFITSCK